MTHLEFFLGNSEGIPKKKFVLQIEGGKSIPFIEMMMIPNCARYILEFLVMIPDVVLLEFNGISG